MYIEICLVVWFRNQAFRCDFIHLYYLACTVSPKIVVINN